MSTHYRSAKAFRQAVEQAGTLRITFAEARWAIADLGVGQFDVEHLGEGTLAISLQPDRAHEKGSYQAPAPSEKGAPKSLDQRGAGV